MDKQFDELSKSLAESCSRREALRRFGVGIAAVAMAAIGIAVHREAEAGATHPCASVADCAHVKGLVAPGCCGGICVDLSSNQNCGFCGNKCKTGKHFRCDRVGIGPNDYYCIPPVP